MRVRRLTTWLVLGMAVALAYAVRRRRGAPARRAVPAVPGPPSARATPVEIDASMLGSPGEPGEMFVEAISEWDLEPDAELGVAVTEPTPGTPTGTRPLSWRPSAPAGPADARVDPNANADANPDILLGEAARADVYHDHRASRGAGDLYGVHVTSAVDLELPDDDQAQAEGENWLEHLEASAGELGPEPEHELDITDESNTHTGHHKTETEDRPVADYGSGGPRGL